MEKPDIPELEKRLIDENRRLKQAVEELMVLNDISTAVSSALTLREIIDLVVEKCVKHLKVEQGAVMLLNTKELESPFKTMIRRAATSAEILPYRLDTELAGWMLKNRRPLLVNDLEKDERFHAVHGGNSPINSILSAPLLQKGRMFGSLNVFNKRSPEGFTENDKRLLTIIATQSAQVIENARLYEEEQALQSMQEEMRLAYKIQMDLLPKESPRIAGYDIAGKSLPAKEVGGDYFDFIMMDDHRMAFCLGDVSGKGMPAALLMSNVQATLRALTQQNLSPKDCMHRSNELIFNSTDAERFVTLFYGILDYRKNTLLYSNAGHNYPFLFKNEREPTRLNVGGLVLGALQDFSFSEDQVSIGPGDSLFVFSDGITEALDQGEEEFGEEKLSELLIQSGSDAADRLLDRVIEAVRRHMGEAPQTDDMTLLTIRRTSEK